MKSVAFGAIVVLVVASAAVTWLRSLGSAEAQSGCSVGSLAGAYGYSLAGSYYDANGYVGLYAAAGRLVADGSGNLTGADTQNDDGTVVRRTYTGSYTLNTDCTGSMLIKIGQATAHGDIVLVSGGKELNFVQTDPNIIFSGVMKAQ